MKNDQSSTEGVPILAPVIDVLKRSAAILMLELTALPSLNRLYFVFYD